MSYGNVYVAHVAFGAKDQHTVHAFHEAESFRGPSLLIAYSHCIAHGYDLAFGLEQQKLAVQSGSWPLYRFDPRRAAEGESPLQLDSGAPNGRLADYFRNEARFRMVEAENPARFKRLLGAAEREIARRFRLYEEIARIRPEADAPRIGSPASGAS